MKSLVELNLRDQPDRPAAPKSAEPEKQEPKPVVDAKRLNKLAKKAAHRAATHSGGGSGLFSK